MSPYRPAPLIKIKQARKEQISNYYSDFDFVEAAFCGGDHTLTMPFERIFGRPAIAPAFCDSLSTTFRYTTYLKPGRPWIGKPFGRMILEALYGERTRVINDAWADEVEAADCESAKIVTDKRLPRVPRSSAKL